MPNNPIIVIFDDCVNLSVLEEAEWDHLWQSYNIGVAVSQCETEGYKLADMVDALSADKRWAKRGLSKGNLSKLHSLVKWGSYDALKRAIKAAELGPSLRNAYTVIGKPTDGNGGGKKPSKPSSSKRPSLSLAVKRGIITDAQAKALRALGF